LKWTVCTFPILSIGLFKDFARAGSHRDIKVMAKPVVVECAHEGLPKLYEIKGDLLKMGIPTHVKPG
jgi:hypothetical protein